MTTQRPLILVVDDLRSFPPLEDRSQVLYARTSQEGIAVLEDLHARGVEISELWLDHDLGEPDGQLDDVRPVVDWILEKCVWDDPPQIQRIVVHTSNSQGAAMMVLGLGNYYSTRRVDALAEGCTIAEHSGDLPG